MYEPFETKAVDHYNRGGGDFIVPVKGFIYDDQLTVAMEIKCSEEYVYITKEQAMKFFGLIEKK